jgi:hypothetical protein
MGRQQIGRRAKAGGTIEWESGNIAEGLNLHDLKWSHSEKKIAREAFDAALHSALTKVMVEFKRRANTVTTPSDMWKIEDYLHEQRREIDDTFDYRYSQLPIVFAQLIREGHLEEGRLAGLADDKLDIIRSILSLAKRQ